jgi:YVTN family beta-propeller protein
MTITNLRWVALAAALVALSAGAGEIAYVSNQGGGVSRIDLTTLTELGSIDLADSAPRGLALTPDRKFLLTANQKSGDVAVIDTQSLKIVRRIAIGVNPEFIRITPDGRRAYVTYEPGVTRAPGGKGEGREDDSAIPAEIAVIDLHRWAVVASIVGAPETEGIEFSSDQKQLIVCNEGDDTLTVHAMADGKRLRTVDLRAWGHRPRGIKRSPDGKRYAVTMEGSSTLAILDADFNVIKSISTAAGPYGVAYDQSGKHLFVAAARANRLQVFDAESLATLADVAIGKRCWHFTFTPDESRILLACGTSNDVEVIDVASKQTVKIMTGFSKPWGIVAAPRANGSLESVPAP